jgi:transcription elongation factor Elf1
MEGKKRQRKKLQNKAKQTLIRNLKEKYRCPLCNRYNYFEDIQEHKVKHQIDDTMNKLANVKLTREITIPDIVKNNVMYAYKLYKNGFRGGSEAIWKISRQLSKNKTLTEKDINFMRSWFKRHRTARDIYEKWQKEGRPKSGTQWTHNHELLSYLLLGSIDGEHLVNSYN